MTAQLMKFIAKDFEIQFKSMVNYLLFSALMFVIIAVMPLNDRQMLYPMIMFGVVYAFINKTLFEDEKNNTLRLLVSLPIKRKVIVYSRYISVFMMIAAVALILFGLSLVFPSNSAGGVISGTGATGVVFIATVLIFLVMISVYLPMAFKLGYVKAGNINRFVFVGVMATFAAAGALLGGMNQNGTPKFLMSLEKSISSFDFTVVIILAVVAVMAIYLASMSLAVRLFNKRNLY